MCCEWNLVDFRTARHACAGLFVQQSLRRLWREVVDPVLVVNRQCMSDRVLVASTCCVVLIALLDLQGGSGSKGLEADQCKSRT